MKPEWRDAPPEANWKAMDKDGCWTWYREEPKPHAELSIWTVAGPYAEHAGWSEPSDDWLSTKERRPEESFENVQCPVCGYYCLGNGGVGCINKPALCGLAE